MKFNYQVRDKQGKMQSGEIEASTKKAALQILGTRPGVFVTFLEETATSPFYAKRIRFFERVGTKEVMLFSRQLSIMFRAKVSLVGSLQAIGAQTKNQSFRESIVRISEEIEGGTAFSQALAMYPNLFSPFYVSMVKRGETLGKLSDVLEYLAEHLEREYELRSKLKTAMIYPAFVVTIAIAVVVLLLTFVIPNLAQILEEGDQDLPAITQFVIGSSNFLVKWGWLLAILAVALGVGLMRYKKTPQGKQVFDRLILRLPVLGSFLKTVYVSRFGENLATLISGGVPFVQALDITSTIIGNARYQEIIAEAKQEVEGGAQVSATLKKYPGEFPPIFTQMVSVGEKTGEIESTLTSIVVFYRREVDRKVEGFLGLIEPVLIVFLGVIVGGLMVSVLLPIYQSVSTFS